MIENNNNYHHQLTMNTYIHKTENRLRIRSDFIKNNSVEVEKLICDLNKIDAISDIKFKKHAGSVAIKFDGKEISNEQLLDILQSHNWTRNDERNFFIENAAIKGTKSLIKGGVTIAISRLVGPSLGRLLNI